ncbi:MAG: ribonucleoside hydrolase RihC [Lactobacillaceae bacterium]|jgi:non-specific riboncleoside hydrolase|nr:ribonucleoside hydrolase RihC [Lactobacillaceae bacterium]
MALPIIMDMDPGIDDAAAIAVALHSPELDIKLFTAVAGNVSVDKTSLNELKLLEFFDRTEIPVAIGAKAPLKKVFKDAANIHGESGMPGYDFPAVTTDFDTRDAVTAIFDTLTAAEQPMTIVATGSYTNIAQLLILHPEIKTKIERFVLMGGSISGGNVSSVAEFNVFTDPDAAKIVFEAGVPIVMIGLDVTLKALISAPAMDKLATLNESGKMLNGLLNAYNDVEAGGKPMHDVNTIFYLLHPEATTLKTYQIDVVTEGPAAGATVADIQNRWSEGRTNAQVGVDVDAEFFERWFLDVVSTMK